MKTVKQIITVLIIFMFLLNFTSLYAKESSVKKKPWFALISIKIGHNTVINGQVFECINGGLCSISIGTLGIENPNESDSYIGFDENSKRILVVGKYDLIELRGKGYDLKTNTITLPETFEFKEFEQFTTEHEKTRKVKEKISYLYKNKTYQINKINNLNIVYLD